MKDINKELVAFLEKCYPQEDLTEIVYQIQTGHARSIRLVNSSQTNFFDADFIFNNQQYKLVVTGKLPMFYSSDDFSEGEGDDYFDGDDQPDDSGDIN